MTNIKITTVFERDLGAEKAKLWELLLALKDSGCIELPIDQLYEGCKNWKIDLTKSAVVMILRSWRIPRGVPPELIRLVLPGE